MCFASVSSSPWTHERGPAMAALVEHRNQDDGSANDMFVRLRKKLLDTTAMLDVLKRRGITHDLVGNAVAT